MTSPHDATDNIGPIHPHLRPAVETCVAVSTSAPLPRSSRRHIVRSDPLYPRATPMSDDLRTVATFATPSEAAVARNALEAAGVRATLADELTLTADPFLSGAVGYIKVQVRETDLERASEILGERGMPVAVDYGDEADDEPDEGDDYPPVSQGERMVEFGYRAAIFGLVTCPGVF